MIGAGVKLKRTWNLAPVIQIVQKITENYCLAYIYHLTKFGDFMSYGSKDIFKRAPCLTDLVNRGIVKNTKS